VINKFQCQTVYVILFKVYEPLHNNRLSPSSPPSYILQNITRNLLPVKLEQEPRHQAVVVFVSSLLVHPRQSR
jgi:hypothetical protein